MAPRYGGDHEDLSRAIREAQQLQRETDELTARESTRAEATRKGARSDETAVSRSRELARARREAEDVARRAARVADVEVKAAEQSTAAIERNRRVRERALETQRRAEAMNRGALQGARDPLFARATELAGGKPPSQYQLRRELAVGQQRAARLQAAAVAGFRPAGPQEARFPATRSMAAEVSLQRAQGDLERATKELANARRRKSVTDEEISDHVLRRDAARRSRDAANLELESAHKQAESAERRRQQVARPPGTDIIRHPELFGTRPGPSIPMGAGGGGRPGVIAEGGPGHGGGRAFAPPVTPSPQVRQATTELNEYTRQLSLMEREANRAREAQVDRYMSRVATEQTRAAAATQAAGVNFGMASQQMTRHGALSSEFIAAAARGETTIREMGNQALVTAGKFAGWITVGAGIYALADAARQVGTGAIAASSGVDQLNRVVNVTDREGAQKAFSDLADQFNVPVDVAADAVYRMGQVYHDQAEATEAATAALYANVTGGLAVEEGTSKLISITQAFGLTANDLTGVFDQVNEAQNEFGATIPDVLAGLAKAGGSFRQAGGDIDYLLGLMVAIQRATGRTGQEIGTGLARGVNQFNLPSHIKALEEQGVEVDPANFQKTIQSAMRRVAQGGDGVDVNAIANALLGNQYGRLLPAVLTDQRVLNQALQKTAPGASRGSAKRELESVLSQADQQVKAIGIGLQELGEALARSGALAPLLLGLKALNLLLDGADTLLEIFNTIPQPLREMVMLFTQGYILLQAMRKLGATDAMAGGPLGFLTNPDQRLKTYAQRGLRDARDSARNEFENYTRRESRAAISNDIATREKAAFQPELARARQLPIDHPDRVQADSRALGLEDNRRRAEQRLARTSAEAAGARQVLTRAEEDLLAVEKLRASETRRFLQASGYTIPNDIAKPSSAGTTVLTRGGQDFTVPGGRQNRIRALAQESRQWGETTTRAVGNMRYGLASLVTMGGRIDREARPLGQVARRLDSAANRTVTGIGNSMAFMGRAKDSLGGLKSSVGQLAGGLGALDIGLIALLVGGAVDSWVDGLDKELDGFESALGRTPNTERRVSDIEDRIRAFEERSTVNMQDFLTRLNDVANPVELFGSTLPGIAAGTYETPGQRAHRLEQEAKQAKEELETRRRLQADARRRGTPRPVMNIEDVQRDIERTAELRRDNIITQAEFDKRMANHAIEIQTAYFPSRAAQQRAQSALTEALRTLASDPDDYRAALKKLPQAELEAQAKGVAQQMAAFGPSDDELQQARAIYGEAVARWGSETEDPKAMAALAESRDAFFGLIERTANDEVKRGLLLSRNEGDRSNAYRDAQGFVRRNITENARNRLRNNQQMLERSEGSIAGLESQRAPGMPAAQRRELEQAIEAEKKRAAQLRRAVKRSGTELRAAERKAEELQAELRQAAYDDRESGRNVRLSLNQARDPDESDQAQMAVRNAQRQVADAAETFGRNSRQYQQALTGLFQARTQAAQAALNEIQAENALLTAQAGDDPVAQARAGVTGAQAVLTQLNGADRARYSDTERTQAQAELITAQNQYDNAVNDQAQRLAELQGQLAAARAGSDPVAQARGALAAARIQTANAEGPVEAAEALLATVQANNELESALAGREEARQKMLASRTDDPVAAARVERLAAQRAVNRATPGTQGFYEAQARLNEARRAEVQAQIDSTTNDIEFERTMGSLSIDDAISRYNTLLQTRNLSKQQKRDILTRIKALQDESESEAGGFNLDVGSLKLPTAYDVRRAFDPVREQVRRQVQEATRSVTGDATTGRRGRIAVNRETSVAQDLSSSVSNMYDQRAQVTAQVNVNVYGREDVAAVYEALDRVLGTSVKAQARSAGRR